MIMTCLSSNWTASDWKFTTQSTQHLLESNNLECGKPPGQKKTSKNSQACNALFRRPNVPYITDESVSNNTEIIKLIEDVFKSTNSCNDSIKLKFDGNHKKKAIIGLIKVSINSEIITKGFSYTGMVDYCTKSYSLNKTWWITSMYLRMTKTLKIIKAVPILAQKVKVKSERTFWHWFQQGWSYKDPKLCNMCINADDVFDSNLQIYLWRRWIL